jgi:hypothetical protein
MRETAFTNRATPKRVEQLKSAEISLVGSNPLCATRSLETVP